MRKTTSAIAMARKLILTLSIAFSSFAGANAQNFVTPTAYEDSYPTAGSPFISRTTHTSCYSFSNLGFSSTTADIVLSAWDAPGLIAAVAWRGIVPGTGGAGIINQGIVPYSNVQDLEVGLLSVNNGYQVIVAYYKNGVGHFFDVYDLNLTGMTYLYTKQLSTMASYTRISMDSHKLYGVAITWQEKFIKSIVLLGGSSLSASGILTLSGSNGYTRPDCAFSHSNQAGTLNVHYAYYHPVSGVIIESSFDFWTAIGLGTTTIFPSVNDANLAAPSSGVNVNLDCPDHYDVENWAYTYTDNYYDISVRFIDYHSTATPTTVVVNDNSVLSSAAINSSMNYNPFLAYDHDCIYGVGTLYVGWVSQYIDPATSNPASYIAVQIKEDGNGPVTPVDYLTVPNNTTLTSGTPYLSFSKQNDATDYLYTIFPQYVNGVGYRMQHKYHAWNNSQFKGATPVYTCNNDEDHKKAFAARNAGMNITLYPNPYVSTFELQIPADIQNEKGSIIITGVDGKTYGTFEGDMRNANSYLSTIGANMPAGNYAIQVQVNGRTQVLKTTKVQ